MGFVQPRDRLRPPVLPGRRLWRALRAVPDVGHRLNSEWGRQADEADHAFLALSAFAAVVGPAGQISGGDPQEPSFEPHVAATCDLDKSLIIEQPGLQLKHNQWLHIRTQDALRWQTNPAARYAIGAPGSGRRSRRSRGCRASVLAVPDCRPQPCGSAGRPVIPRPPAVLDRPNHVASTPTCAKPRAQGYARSVAVNSPHRCRALQATRAVTSHSQIMGGAGQ